ncbi:SIMPL domain-containing protein [Neobacillus dielmonensis]|uniref:SIMPL domain-containing protein n=1 Tax=Neobacillus dielmonensis TaxID=1347369 RepID=UPI0006939D8E|nr:SIMPL domain-containing protein [Neobacillus dielmonensis]
MTFFRDNHYLSYRQPPYRNKDDYTITVEGKGRVTVQPDQANITVGVITTDSNVQTAQQENANITNRVLAAIRKAGIEQDDIKTKVYTVNPRYDYVEGKSEFRGYEVEHLFQITVKDLSKIGAIYDLAIKEGANRTENIQFQNSQEDLHYLQALTLAVNNAVTKAEQIAHTLGVILNRIPLKVREQSPTPQVFTQMSAESLAFSAKNTTTPIQPGENTLHATVSAVFQYNLS